MSLASSKNTNLYKILSAEPTPPPYCVPSNMGNFSQNPTYEEAAAIHFFQGLIGQEENVQDPLETSQKEFTVTTGTNSTQDLMGQEENPQDHPENPQKKFTVTTGTNSTQDLIGHGENPQDHPENLQKEFTIATDTNPTPNPPHNKNMSIPSPQNSLERTINHSHSAQDYNDYNDKKRHDIDEAAIRFFEKTMASSGEKQPLQLDKEFYEEFFTEKSKKGSPQLVYKKEVARENTSKSNKDVEDDKEENHGSSENDLLLEMTAVANTVQPAQKQSFIAEQTQDLSDTAPMKQQFPSGKQETTKNLQQSTQQPLQKAANLQNPLGLDPFDDNAVLHLQKMIDSIQQELDPTSQQKQQTFVFETQKSPTNVPSQASPQNTTPLEKEANTSGSEFSSGEKLPNAHKQPETRGEKSTSQDQNSKDNSNSKEQKTNLNNNLVVATQNLPVKEGIAPSVPQTTNPEGEKKTLGKLFTEVVHQLEISKIRGDSAKLTLNESILPGTSVQLKHQPNGGVEVLFLVTSATSYEKILRHIDILRESFAKSMFERPLKLVVKHSSAGTLETDSSEEEIIEEISDTNDTQKVHQVVTWDERH